MSAEPGHRAVGRQAAEGNGVPFHPHDVMATEQNALLARLQAPPGKEDEVAAFLTSALPLALQEDAATQWCALCIDDSTFFIFADDAGRLAHLDGSNAAALMERAEALLGRPPP